ncbi:MAG: alpha/beta hydrolase [Candidatus Limivicinus sp.]|nr:alpha/beta hydrolase [Candidatus Limivicinus sp.]
MENIRNSKHKKSFKIWLCIALAFLLVGSIGASLVRTSGNTVQLIETYIPDVEGTFIHATIFRPKTATAENPAPVVVTCHGYSDSGEKQDFAAIELSRRGVVVVEMDAKSHGLSSTSNIDSSPASTFGEGCGLFAVIDFLMESKLDYIDKSQLGVTGHSMGGLATMATIEHYGGLQTAALEAAALPDSDGGVEITEEELENAKALNPVKAAFMQSALTSSDPGAYGNFYIPVALNYTYYDEGNYSTANGNGDLRTAPEAIAFVNSVLPEESQITSVEIGKIYGSIEDGTMRVVYNPPSIHTFEYLTPSCATNLVSFFSMCFDIDTSIPATNHTFLWRFCFSALALLGLAILVPLLVIALLETKFFSKIVVPVPEAKVTLKSKKDKGIFWGCWALITVITVLLLVPVIRLDAKIFPVVATMGYAKLYTSINVNSFAIWDVFIALVILAIFLVLYFTKLKKEGWTIEDLGLKVTGNQIIRIILLALSVGCIYYVITFGVYYLLKVDLRAWAISAKPFNPDKISMWVQYLPWFFVYMFVQALATNTINRVKDQKNNLLINVLGNIAGLVIIAVFAYTYLFSAGVSFPAWQTAWDRVMQTIPFTMYTIATVIITRKCFENTGTIWTGAFVNSIIVTMMLVANTSMFLTLH